MSDDFMENNPNPDPSAQDVGDTWKDVGKQFEALGQGISEAFRAVMNSSQARDAQADLEKMVLDINMAVKRAADSPEGQKIRSETARTVDTIKAATRQTGEEMRPQVISALKKLNAELQKLIERIEKGDEA